MHTGVRTLLLCLCCWVLSSCSKDLLHWETARQLDTHGAHRLNKVRFINDSLAIAVGGERFYHTDILVSRDGGFSWELQSHPVAGKELFGLTVAPGGGIYTVGFDGKLLWSTDGGNSWSFRQLTFNPYKALAFRSPTEALLVGGISFETGFTEEMDTAGNPSKEMQLDYELNDLVLLPDGTGYRCGYGVMEKTTDGGRTWHFQDITSDNFTALRVQRPGVVWTCGYNGSIFKTADGGGHWSCQRNGNDITKPRYRLYDILMVDDRHGYAIGENGLVIYTDDAGDHWSELDRFTTNTLYSIALCPDGDLLICGDNGTLFRMKPQG